MDDTGAAAERCGDTKQEDDEEHSSHLGCSKSWPCGIVGKHTTKVLGECSRTVERVSLCSRPAVGRTGLSTSSVTQHIGMSQQQSPGQNLGMPVSFEDGAAHLNTSPRVTSYLAVAVAGGQVYVVSRAGGHNGNSRQEQLPPIPVATTVRVRVPSGKSVTPVVHLPELKTLRLKAINPCVRFALEPFGSISMALVECQ